jgi:hypothetical protein
MDYKKIITSQEWRFKILRMLSWIPDPVMLRIQYRIKMGFWPDFKHPKRFTEKIQLYKMKYRNPVMHQCVDKYEVRKYVESKGLEHILNELYGVHDKPEEIDFDALPEEFVMKTTNGGGGQNVIVTADKSTCNYDELRGKLALWEGTNNLGALAGREWAYEGCRPRIIIEKFLEDRVGEGNLSDYKFFCFGSHPYCVQVDSGRYDSHRQNFYDMQWNSLGVHCSYPEGEGVEKPLGFDEMKQLACQLSKEFPFVRVDFYNVGGKIYFGELTFYPSSGYGKFTPDSFDLELGSRFTQY